MDLQSEERGTTSIRGICVGLVSRPVSGVLILVLTLVVLDNYVMNYEEVVAASTITFAKSYLYPHVGPLPIILMSLGRSGSTSTWQVISNLTGGHELKMEEYPGSSTPKALRVLNKNTGNNGQWVLTKLHQKQMKNPHAAVVGFKWKPLHDTMDHPAFREGLQAVARNQIKIIRSRRNPLDVALSRIKHGESNTHGKGTLGTVTGLNYSTKKKHIPAHCMAGRPDYEMCLRTHLAAGTGMIVKPQKLLKFLEGTTRSEDAVDDLLNEMGIQYVSVSFEKLYYHSEDANEWERIFQFMGVGPATGLTRTQVHNAMGHVATSNTHHNVSIGNYEEVQSVLEGTPYEHLLH